MDMEMVDATWTVVQFEDQSVEAVPTSWIQGEYCHWPPYKKEKLCNAIKKCEGLNTCWPRHLMKMFRNATFGEYGTARQKAKQAEEVSDLNSGSESQEKGKRKRIQRLLSSSSDDSTTTTSSKLPPRPKMAVSQSASNQSQNTDQSVGNCEMQQPSKPHRSFGKTPTSITGDFYVNTATTSCDVVIHNSPKEDVRSCCLQREHTLLSEIKTQNHMIRCMLADVLKELRDKKPERDCTAPSIFVKYSNISFPIQNDCDLNSFEEELKIEEQFIEAVNELAKFGGANPYNFIKRTTSTLIKDSLLMKYSWLGRKGKRPFHNLNVAKMLIHAADKCLNCTQKETEAAIQSFIKRSSERVMAKENKKN